MLLAGFGQPLRRVRDSLGYSQVFGLRDLKTGGGKKGQQSTSVGCSCAAEREPAAHRLTAELRARL
ncbi:MAG: hypothetical protein DWH97_07680 [Planctomycetota bacterium]|nr:MAG: hypothetical protein DWH97_07680 [Planctomycetota bacterium]RLS96478.1 MAG: hypothetical protein DWI12_02280 [Planctomycetota bacterium]